MISVCIPTYNGQKYIKQQLESILIQLSQEDEIIISDDSSSDDTLKIIKAFNDSRITILENNKFHSPIYNLENALKNAKGDYIFLSDQDDIWKKDKVKIIIDNLQHSNLVVHDAEIIDENNNLINESFYIINKTHPGIIHNLIKNGFIGCCMAFNRKVLDVCLPFPKGIPMHDSWIGIKTYCTVKNVNFIPDRLIEYRRHGNNASVSGEKSRRPLFQKLKDRMIIINSVIKSNR